MKAAHPKISLEVLCGLFGISRQGYHQYRANAVTEAMEETIILNMVREYRKDQRKVGCRKLLLHLTPILAKQGIEIGRDALFDLLRAHSLLVRRRRRKAQTTDSNHPYRKYKNLIKSFKPLKANQLWVSDITYVDTDEGFVYLFLITDDYSHKIVGYHPSLTLEATSAIAALQMALRQISVGEKAIHHSDRGSQYCSGDYVALLNKYELPISMTETSDPCDNPVAERVNGILKNDLMPEKILTKKSAIESIHYFIDIYNRVRLHSTVDMLTPNQAHLKTGHLTNRWKPKTKPIKQPQKDTDQN
jgi:putative transposase